MPAERRLITQFYIKVAGSELQPHQMDDLFDIEVDQGFHMPAAATLKFYDQEMSWLESGPLKLGATVEISAKDASGSRAGLFKGVLTNLEPEFVSGGPYAMFVARCYDKSFRLHRGTKSAVYVQMTDSDVVQQIAGDAGISVTVDATTVVHKHLIRHDQSDFEFISALARRNGYLLWCDDDKLLFQKASQIQGAQITCEYGEDLTEFRPRFALGGQVNEVKVQGWDLVSKREVVGVARSAGFEPVETSLGRGAAEATNAFGNQSIHVTATPDNQSFAEGLADSVLNRMAASDVTAEGRVLGNVNLKPGSKLTVTHVGKFSGSYFVTRVRHHFGQEEPYTTDVWLGGLESGTIASLLRDDSRKPGDHRSTQARLIRGIVTANDDEAGYGRVKVKLPTLGDDIETFWAPLVSAGAGNARGFQVMPEINDEVLVGFMDGNISEPVVLGGLWNGQDLPPNAAAIGSDGSVDVREFKTRVGHVLRFTDKSGGEKIELIDKTGSNLLQIDSAANTVTIKAAKDIVLEAQGNIELKAVNIKLTGSAKVQVGAPVVEASGDSQITLKGAMANLQGSAMTKISGGMVQIN